MKLMQQGYPTRVLRKSPHVPCYMPPGPPLVYIIGEPIPPITSHTRFLLGCGYAYHRNTSQLSNLHSSVRAHLLITDRFSQCSIQPYHLGRGSENVELWDSLMSMLRAQPPIWGQLAPSPIHSPSSQSACRWVLACHWNP